MKLFALWLMLVTSFVLTGCASKNTTETDVERRFTLLHTNDHHGRFWQNEQGEYGMAARKTLIDSLRAEAEAKGQQVLLLSGGDINTGVPESDMMRAEPDFKAMAMLGYDALAIGNHEFDHPISVLAQQQQWAGFPFLSANIIDKQRNAPAYQTYALFQRSGLSIAVIGLTTTDTAKLSNPLHIANLDFIEPLTATNTVLAQLETIKPDVVIAVTHMGHFTDGQHGLNAPGDVALARGLAKNSVDVIVGGHSQEPVCMASENVGNANFRPGDACQPDQQNGVWIMQAHEWGKYVGKAEFSLSNGEVTLVSYQLIPVNLKTEEGGYATEYIEPDASMYEFLKPYYDKGAAEMTQTIATMNGRLNGDRNQVRLQQTNLGQFILAAQMEKVSADVGIISSGGIRSSIEDGAVNYRHILSVHPFKNRLNFVDMTGDELFSYLTTVIGFPPDSGAYVQIRGATFTVASDGKRALWVNGQQVASDKNYRISLNSYNANGGDGYPVLINHSKFQDSGYIDAEVLADYMRANTPLNAADYQPN